MMLVVFWGVVVCLELLVGKWRKKRNAQQGGGGEEGNHEDVVAAIIAGINAHEGFFKKEGTKTRRVICVEKGEKIPPWRTKERIK